MTDSIRRASRASTVTMILTLVLVIAFGAVLIREDMHHRAQVCRDMNDVRVTIQAVIDGAVDAGRASTDPEYARRFEAVAATVSEALEKQPC